MLERALRLPRCNFHEPALILCQKAYNAREGIETLCGTVSRAVWCPSVRKHTMLERALRPQSLGHREEAVDGVRKHTMLERALRLLAAVPQDDRCILRQKAYNAREGIETRLLLNPLVSTPISVRKHTMLERALRPLVTLPTVRTVFFTVSESIQCSRGH